MKNTTFKRILFVLLGCAFSSPVSMQWSDRLPQVQLSWNLEAHASSGGRSGGGSFRSAPPVSESAPPVSPSYPLPEESFGDYPVDPYGGYVPAPRPQYPRSTAPYAPYRRPYPRQSVPNPIVIPVPVGPSPYADPYSGRYTTTEGDNSGLLSLILFGGFGFALFAAYLKAQSMRRPIGGSAMNQTVAGGTSENELRNQTMTVSKVQVALLAQAQDVQAALTTISLEADTQTREGLHQLLQESVLLLLRSPENWSHVSAVSQTVHRLEQAEALFSELSITERSKFKVETLTHVGGKLYQKAFTPPAEQDPGAYIVVTLLVGSAHDRPLFDGVRTEETLRTALQSLAALPLEYLMVFEVLWSPQNSHDHLTYDEMLTEYPNMIPL